MEIQKNVVVLTRDKNYRKKQSALGKITGIRYKKFPKFVELMNTRYSDIMKCLITLMSWR